MAKEFVSPEGLRLDGRRPHEMRHLHALVGVDPSSDGSALFHMGNTKVMAVVYGPHEVQNRTHQLPHKALVRCEYSMATFSTGERRRRRKTDSGFGTEGCVQEPCCIVPPNSEGDAFLAMPLRSTEISLVIGQTLEAAIMTHLLPRSQIDIYVQVLQADGGTRAACINAASLALADAGIPMRDLVVSCASGYLNSTPLLDLNYQEDSGGGPDLVVGYFPKLENLSLLQMDSKVPIETFEKVLELATEGSKAIATFMRETLLENTKTLASARGLIKI